MSRLCVTFLGAPGAGKGTQAKKLSLKFGLPHISTGDILRNAVKTGTPLGLRAKSIMERGELVPDDIMLGIIRERLAVSDCTRGFLMDGFPRTMVQAEAFELIAPVSLALKLSVPESLLVRRLALRRTCTVCGAMYHLEYHPPKSDGVCDQCGSALMQRDDDKEDVVKSRLAVYEEKTSPLVDYYRKMNVLHEVDGARDPETVFTELSQLVEAAGDVNGER